MQQAKILVVDDEPTNLDILEEYLKGVGYQTVAAKDGVMALEILERTKDFDLIVLDRMMPKLDGIEVLKKITAHEKLKSIPVILQTAASSSDQIIEGMQSGAYYYLTKPYDEVLLLSVVHAALFQRQLNKTPSDELTITSRVMPLMDSGTFRIRTLEEARYLAYFLARVCPNRETAFYGLVEILSNAIEHGNLGIGHEIKKRLMEKGAWSEEVNRRHALEENAKKVVTVTYLASADKLSFTIKDQGQGFDWSKYMSNSPDFMTKAVGRGIAIARTISFDSMVYRKGGCEVECSIIPSIEVE